MLFAIRVSGRTQAESLSGNAILSSPAYTFSELFSDWDSAVSAAETYYGLGCADDSPMWWITRVA